MNLKFRFQDGTERDVSEAEFDQVARTLGYTRASGVNTSGASARSNPATIAELQQTIVALSETVQRMVRGERTPELARALDGIRAGVTAQNTNAGDDVPLPAADPLDEATRRIMRERPGTSELDAQRLALSEHPEVWDAHRAYLAGTPLPRIRQKRNHHRDPDVLSL
jgi:hypothetical protein